MNTPVSIHLAVKLTCTREIVPLALVCTTSHSPFLMLPVYTCSHASMQCCGHEATLFGLPC